MMMYLSAIDEGSHIIIPKGSGEASDRFATGGPSERIRALSAVCQSINAIRIYDQRDIPFNFSVVD